MPSLTNVRLSKRAFAYNPSITIHSIAKLCCSPIDVGALAGVFMKPDSLATANVHSIAELHGLETTIKTIMVDNNSCNDEDFTQLDLSPFVNLMRFEVGSFSFAYVVKFHVYNMQFLESIIIGEKSFVDNTIGFEDDVTYGELSITECPNLRELRIGYYCFKYCLSFSLRNLSSLETFDMGNVKISTDSFMLSSFEMKSIIHYGFNE